MMTGDNRTKLQRRPSSLPVSLAPLGLSRVVASEFVGVGVTKFDLMVEDGRMPKPRRIDGRKVWDRRQLEEAFAELPIEGGDRETPNPWDGVSG